MVYIVVNEGEIVMATRDEDKALAFSLDSSEEVVKDIVEESGRDIDDLTPEELDEFRVRAGYDGGHYAVESISEDDLQLEEVETENSGTFDTSEILEMLEADEDDMYDDFDTIEDDDSYEVEGSF